MSMEEFTYKYHGYKEAPHIELANLISDLYYRQDRDGLETLLESALLKAEGNPYARLNGIVIKVALAALAGRTDFDEEDRKFLADYLFAIEEWTSFELYLFLNAQMLLNDHMIVSLLSELKNKSKSYLNLRKHRDYLKKILINSVGEMIERKRYGLAEEFLTELERMVETTDAFEQIFVNYFKLCIELIKSGSSMEFQTKTEAYIASVGLIVSSKVSTLLERHYKLCVLKEDC